MWKHLEPGSSPVDWCEENYTISPVIAEFVNTLSNVLFILLPPLLMHLFREYARFVNPAIHVVWLLLMVVGLSSAYFHATLSLIGQLLDELSILWVMLAAFSMFMPRWMIPGIFNNSRKQLSVAIGSIGIVASILSVMYPIINAFALMLLGVPTVGLLITELGRVKCQRVHRLGIRCVAMWLLAVTCWVCDRAFCKEWSVINYLYLHGMWHIFICIASYTGCVLFAYFAVKDEHQEHTPVLKYWPRDDFELGIPYVTVRCYYKDGDNNANHEI